MSDRPYDFVQDLQEIAAGFGRMDQSGLQLRIAKAADRISGDAVRIGRLESEAQSFYEKYRRTMDVENRRLAEEVERLKTERTIIRGCQEQMLARLQQALAERDAALVDANGDSRRMFVARLEAMFKGGDRWLTIPAVLALLNNCDMLASRDAAIVRAAAEMEPK